MMEVNILNEFTPSAFESVRDKCELYKSKYLYMFEKCNKFKRKIKQQSHQKEALRQHIKYLENHI